MILIQDRNEELTFYLISQYKLFCFVFVFVFFLFIGTADDFVLRMMSGHPRRKAGEHCVSFNVDISKSVQTGAAQSVVCGRH